MNILFLTMNTFTGIDMHNIYSDLMTEFIKNGHKPYIVTPREKKTGEATELTDYGSHAILKVQTGNMSDVSLIEKGISTVTLSGKYYKAVKKYLGSLKFALILYSTPPITLVGPIKKLKKRFGATTYLMLKDIFPQNAVDLGMFSENSPIYKYFRHQEKTLYSLSDKIGCMSPANVEYVINHNPKLNKDIVELCPNAIIPGEMSDRSENKLSVRKKYNIPDEAVIYMYGGNLGKPQGIPFLVDCLRANKNKKDRFFFICGNGSEQHLVKDFIAQDKPQNVVFIDFLPKAEYDSFVKGCDIGLIFLDHRFTIPNFPSRALSYMENSMPIYCATDVNSDMGQIAEKNGFGLRCESNNVQDFTAMLDKTTPESVSKMGTQARKYLIENYTVSKAYDAVTKICKF